MSQEQYEEEEDFQQSGGGWWIKWIGIIVYIAIIVAYAIQTLELVAWLFPGDTWFMKSVTVFVCDGCATGYAMAEMFYRFRLRKSKHLVFGMWIITFALSTAATVIQMYLSSTHNVPHAIDPTVISIAYGLIIVAFVVNIVAITVIIRMEHGASHPAHRYLDDKPRKRLPLPSAPEIQSAIFKADPDTRVDMSSRRTCVAHGTPAAGLYQGQPYCQTCLDNIENSFSKPSMTTDDLARLFEQYQEKERLYKMYEEAGKPGSFSAFVKGVNSPLAPAPNSQTGQNGHNH